MEGLRGILNTVVFWSAWVIIPVLMEFIPSLVAVFRLLVRKRRWRRQEQEDPAIWPEISVIIPVYNSEDTLRTCIQSVSDSTYPNSAIRIFLVNNQGSDRSFEVFARCQAEFPDLHMQWLNAFQGKSRALNMALYNSEGKYIINIDSDGRLHKDALANMVRKFEAHPDLNVMTGSILTEPKKIMAYKNPFARLLRHCEFMEYAQAFLAGRSSSSETDSIYTLSGAFSAFRKSAILQSRLYNTETISEDTQLTFQMRYLHNERIESCENAIFFVDPIESMNKLYVQRQRWQRGSLEVANMFMKDNLKLRKAFTDPNMHTLLYDHTFAFPRLIWYLALILLTWLSYSGTAVLIAFGIILILYIITGYLYFFTAMYLLREEKEVLRYYRRHWWVVAILPLYNFMTFFIRIAGIINSIGTDSEWRTRDLTDEGHAFQKVLKGDAEKFRRGLKKADRFFNVQEKRRYEGNR